MFLPAMLASAIFARPALDGTIVRLIESIQALISEIIKNALLLFSLCVFQRLIILKWLYSDATGRIASGVLFGTAAIVAMHWSFELKPGIIFDARTVVLSLAGLFGGPVTAIISGAIAVSYRLYLGGSGTPVGTMVIVSAVLIGLGMRAVVGTDLTRIGVVKLLLFGLAVHLVEIALFTYLPMQFFSTVFKPLAVPFVSILTLSTAVMGLFLQEVEKSRYADLKIEESEQRFEKLFDTAAVALLEEDLTEVMTKLDEIRTSGVTDLKAHLEANPNLVSDLIRVVKVTNANKYAIELFKAPSVIELIGDVGKYYGPGAREFFIERLQALWDGVPTIVGNAKFKRSDGVVLSCVVSMPVPQTVLEATRVPVSVTDVTSLENARRVLADERQKLQQIVWGTRTGTWEWDVGTGKAVFNERWAEIVGYTLAELGPLSYEMWESFVHPVDLKIATAALEDVLNRKNEYYESTYRMRHKDGSWVWVLDRGTVVEWSADNKPLRMSGTHTDVTSLKKAEIQAKERVLYSEAMLSFQGLILEGYSQRQLMQRLAEILARSLDLNLIWIGMPDGEKINLIAKAGKQAALFDALSMASGDDDHDPCKMAVQRKQVYIMNDLATDPCCFQWARQMGLHNLKSAASLPIVIDNDVKYSINLYSEDANDFKDHDALFLSELANNISLALQASQATQDANTLRQELYNAAYSAISAIAATIEQRDPYTSGHQRNCSALAVAIAEKMELSKDKIEGIRLGAIVHDIGKIHIPADILNYPRKLSEVEYEIIKVHPLVGYQILEGTSFPWPIKEMILQHHERINGSGYPNGIAGNDIIVEAKILAVADVVDAMTSHRPYRPALSNEEALAEILQGRGELYDPDVVDACQKLLNDKTFIWAVPSVA